MTLKKILFGIFILALFLRILAVVTQPESKRLPYSDAKCYDKLAMSIVSGEGFSEVIAGEKAPTMRRTPLYSMFLAGIYAIFGHNYMAVKIIQAFLGALLCIIVFFIAYNIYNSRIIGFISSLGVAIYKPYFWGFHYYGGPALLLTECFYMFIVGLAILTSILFIKKEDKKLGALSGVLISLAILTRPEFVFFPLVLFFYSIGKYFILSYTAGEIWRGAGTSPRGNSEAMRRTPFQTYLNFNMFGTGRKGALRSAIGAKPLWTRKFLSRVIPKEFSCLCYIVRFSIKKFCKKYLVLYIFILLTMAPWIIRNYMVSGRFVPLTSVYGGMNFWLGNNDSANGGWADPDNYNIILQMKGISDHERQKIFFRKAIEALKRNPKRIPRLLIKKILVHWAPFEEGFKIFNPYYAIILLFGSIAIIFFRRHSVVEDMLLIVFVSTTLLAIILLGDPRWRFPYEFCLIIFAAHAMVEIFGITNRIKNI